MLGLGVIVGVRVRVGANVFVGGIVEVGGFGASTVGVGKESATCADSVVLAGTEGAEFAPNRYATKPTSIVRPPNIARTRQARQGGSLPSMTIGF